MSNRTEKATPKRREQAREKGQTARQPELATAISFGAGLLMLGAIGEDLRDRAIRVFKTAVLHITSDPLTPLAAYGMLIDACLTLAALTLPVVAVAMVASIASNLAQGGWTIAPGALAPSFDKFNPVKNLKRVFGTNSVMELIKGSVKLVGLAIVCGGLLTSAIADAPALVGAPAAYTFEALGSLGYQLGLRAGVILLLAAALDYGYGLYKFEKSLRMTKQEVKDEYRQQEGDPMVKSQRRRQARQLIGRRIAAEVPRADVVVTNPTHFAVALRYDTASDHAPVVVAKGADQMARRIREIARAHEVMIIENPPLARTLYRTVEPGHQIPADLFRAVAELLAYVYRQRERAKGFR